MWVSSCCSKPTGVLVWNTLNGCRETPKLQDDCDTSLIKLSRRYTGRPNSFSRKRRNRIHCGRHRHSELGLLGHRAFRDEALPAVREVCLDPSASCIICAHRLCRAPIRCHFHFDWRHGHRGGQQAFLFIDVPLRAEFMVGSCVGLLRLLSGDNFAAQGCFTDDCWLMAVVQLGLHDRVWRPQPVHLRLCSLKFYGAAFANIAWIASD